jgi:hypothetical protein
MCNIQDLESGVGWSVTTPSSWACGEEIYPITLTTAGFAFKAQQLGSADRIVPGTTSKEFKATS